MSVIPALGPGAGQGVRVNVSNTSTVREGQGVRVNVVNAAQDRLWALLSEYYSRFTVGGQFHIRVINVNNVQKARPWALSPALLPFPFHCWVMFRTSQIINFMSGMREDGLYTGGTLSCLHSPVSLLGKS